MREYFLGGDISKGYSNFIFLDKMKRIVEKNFQLDDTSKGHKILTMKVADLFKENPQATLYAGFESTGGYENNWIQLFMKLSTDYNVKVARLNPLGVRYHHKASLKRNTTDPISAKDIAEYLISYPAKVVYNQEIPYTEARSLYGHIEILTKQNTQLLNLLESEVYKAHPSLMCYWKDDMPEWLLSVIMNWPTARDLSEASVEKIDLIPYVTKERARELKRNARESVASAVSPITGVTIKSLATQIIQKREAIKKLKKDLYRLFPLPEVEILKSIPGISDYSAYGLILEIGGIDRFDSGKKLSSYFGVHPVYKESGDEIIGYHMSKQGRRRPRRLLYLAAMSAVQCDPLMKELYERHVEAGREKKDALCIIMHKLVRIIYAMLKHKRKYDPLINKSHRVQYYQNEKNTNSKKEVEARRFQDYDQLAPISRRHTKKRQKQMREGEAEVNATKKGNIMSSRESKNAFQNRKNEKIA